MNINELIELLGAAAKEIASEGHNGWGNTCTEAVQALRLLNAENTKLVDIVETHMEGIKVLQAKVEALNTALEQSLTVPQQQNQRLRARVEVLEGVIQCAMQTTTDHQVRDVLDMAGIELAATEQEGEI